MRTRHDVNFNVSCLSFLCKILLILSTKMVINLFIRLLKLYSIILSVFQIV